MEFIYLFFLNWNLLWQLWIEAGYSCRLPFKSSTFSANKASLEHWTCSGSLQVRSAFPVVAGSSLGAWVHRVAGIKVNLRCRKVLNLNSDSTSGPCSTFPVTHLEYTLTVSVSLAIHIVLCVSVWIKFSAKVFNPHYGMCVCVCVQVWPKWTMVTSRLAPPSDRSSNVNPSAGTWRTSTQTPRFPGTITPLERYTCSHTRSLTQETNTRVIHCLQAKNSGKHLESKSGSNQLVWLCVQVML